VGHSIQSVLDFHPESQIIVVDDESSDNSKRIVRMFKTCSALSIVDSEEYSPGAAINQGVLTAVYDNILLLSAHCQLTSPVEPAVSLLHGYAAIWGRQLPRYQGKRVTPRYIWKNFGPEMTENFVAPGEDRYFLHNALALYKTDTLVEYPFDEELMGKEDRYWARMMIEDHSKDILYFPRLTCLHHWTEHGATWQDE